MSQSFTDPQWGAWLGYRDGRLCGIDLPGFHCESFKEWASRYDRSEIADPDTAIQRWDEAHR